jgi:hypothetical protein
MKESMDRNACILLISLQQKKKNIEMEEKAPDEQSIPKSPTDLLNLAACGLNKNKMKVARRSSLTSRLSVGLRGINRQVMDLPGTLCVDVLQWGGGVAMSYANGQGNKQTLHKCVLKFA